MKTPYKNPQPPGNGNGKRRGRRPGTKNAPGHRAGRPRGNPIKKDSFLDRDLGDNPRINLKGNGGATGTNGGHGGRTLALATAEQSPALLPENEWEMYKPVLVGLDDNELQFVIEYMVDMNARNAALRLGFSKTNAANIGSLVLNRPHVRRAVDALLEIRARNAAMVANRLLIGLDELAHLDKGELLDEHGCFLPLDEWPAIARQALVGFEVEELWVNPGQDRVQIGTVKKARFIDPLRARELLGRHLKLWGEPQVNIQNNTQYNVDMDVQLDLSRLDTAQVALLEHLLGLAGAGREVLDLLPPPEGLGPGGL